MDICSNRIVSSGFKNTFDRQISIEIAEGRDIRIMAIHPYARSNPGNRLLYSESYANNFATIPLLNLNDLDFVVPSDRSILHLHWINDLFSEASTNFEKKKIIASYLKKLDQIRDRGWRIIWTLHNIFPHQCSDRKAQAILYQGVAERCSLIHAHNPRALEMINRFYKFDVPCEYSSIPLPSYVNAFGDFVSREEARRDLGFYDKDFVILCFGAILPYKNIELLVDSCLSMDSEIQILIVGPVGSDEYLNKLRAIYGAKTNLFFFPDKVADSELQFFFNAADYCWAGYSNALTSGVIISSLSFGIPVIAHESLVYGYEEFVEDGSVIKFSDQFGLQSILSEISSNQIDARSAAKRKEKVIGLVQKNFLRENVSNSFFKAVDGVFSEDS